MSYIYLIDELKFFVTHIQFGYAAIADENNKTNLRRILQIFLKKQKYNFRDKILGFIIFLKFTN